MEPCILGHFVVHRTTACVACVKEQSLRMFKIKEKQSSVWLGPTSICFGDSTSTEMRKMMLRIWSVLPRDTFFPRSMMWSSSIYFSPAAENPGVRRHHVAKAPSAVTPMEGDTRECESLDSSLESPNNPGVTGSCTLVSPQKSRLESITRTSYCYLHFCLYHNIQVSSSYSNAMLPQRAKEYFSEQKWKQLLCNGSELP